MSRLVVFSSSLVMVVLLSAPLTGASDAPLSAKEQLGKLLFFDTSLSVPEGQSCAVCHAPEVGFTGPDEEFNKGGSVYEGAFKGRFGSRKPPASSYGGGQSHPLFRQEREGVDRGHVLGRSSDRETLEGSAC